MGRKRIITGYIDEYGRSIRVGDLCECSDGYILQVRRDSDGEDFHGVLVCEPGNSCAGIPYSLNCGCGLTVFATVSHRSLVPVKRGDVTRLEIKLRRAEERTAQLERIITRAAKYLN